VIRCGQPSCQQARECPDHQDRDREQHRRAHRGGEAIPERRGCDLRDLRGDLSGQAVRGVYPGLPAAHFKTAVAGVAEARDESFPGGGVADHGGVAGCSGVEFGREPALQQRPDRR
jgi:hypothetical protein